MSDPPFSVAVHRSQRLDAQRLKQIRRRTARENFVVTLVTVAAQAAIAGGLRATLAMTYSPQRASNHPLEVLFDPQHIASPAWHSVLLHSDRPRAARLEPRFRQCVMLILRIMLKLMFTRRR